MWTISVDGEIYVPYSNWSIAEKTLLPPLEIGGHTINIQAEDSSSNSGNLSFQFSIEPPSGFSIEVTDTSLSEKPFDRKQHNSYCVRQEFILLSRFSQIVSPNRMF